MEPTFSVTDWLITLSWHPNPVEVACKFPGDISLPSGRQPHHYNHSWRVCELGSGRCRVINIIVSTTVYYPHRIRPVPVKESLYDKTLRIFSMFKKCIALVGVVWSDRLGQWVTNSYLMVPTRKACCFLNSKLWLTKDLEELVNKQITSQDSKW